MSRAKLFIENFLIYGLGGVISGLIPFLMLPIVTRLMPGTDYFGLNDLFKTIVALASALGIAGMYDAMFRMFFEREDDLEYKKRICSTALIFVLLASLAVAALIIAFKDFIAQAFFGDDTYLSLVYIAAAASFCSSANSLLQGPTRMQNKRTVFVVMNCVIPILSYSIAILLLMMGEYALALPLGALLSNTISCIVFWALNRKWFNFSLFGVAELKELLLIGLPLMPNFIFYWVFASADRLMIVNYLGVGEAGIYAAALNIGQISQLIYMAFAQGWQYFAFSTMRDSDQVEMTSRIYEYLGVISLLAAAALIVVLKPLFLLLFPAEYQAGIVAAPYLFLAPLSLMLYQTAANQLLVAKKTWPSLLMLMFGVIVNLVLNALLIPAIGIEGAAIATLCGYLVANIAALIVLSRIRLLNVDKRLYSIVALFAIYFLAWRFFAYAKPLLLVSLFVLFCVILLVEYRKDVRTIFTSLSGKK